jgi:hypothetical protein
MSKFCYTDEELINTLNDFYITNGRKPMMKDFSNAGTFSSRFGSWNKALERAGIPKGKLRETDYDKDYLLNCLHKYHKETGLIPTIRGLKSKGYPTAHAFINHFGSFKNALIESGLFELRSGKHQFCETYTDEEMLSNLKKYMNGKDKIPVHSIIKRELSNPSISAYERRFYSIFNALEMIGFNYEEQKENELIQLQNDMIIKYKLLKEKLGRVPSSRDIEYNSRKYKNINSMSSYEFHFGSLYELQILCGFTPTVIGRNKSRRDLLNDLIMMSDELGKTPSQLDVKHFDGIASACRYTKEFGSWVNAIKEAGLKPVEKTYYSIKGTKCLSYYELLFTNMLETYDIDFEKESYYKDYMITDRKFRFDYVLNYNNRKYFIEIFGMVDNKSYEEKIKLKSKMCKENNLKLIGIYPNDFSSYKLENIYQMFIEKLD